MPGLTRRYGRRAERLRSTLAAVGLALAGRAGARMARVSACPSAAVRCCGWSNPCPTQFLTHIGGSGAAPFYGLMPLERCSLLVMNPRGEPGTPRGFERTEPRAHGRDLFLHVIEMGCTDVCVIAVTGPLTGRVLIGNSDGFWGPNVSSATDFLDWYERWLNHMSAGRDTRTLELTSP